MSSSIAPANSANAPRARILFGSAEVPGAISCHVTATNNRQAAQFSAEIAIVSGSAYDANWWSSQGLLRLTVQLGLADASGAVSGWTTLITGDADTLDLDIVQGTVRVSGRDLTHLLIDQKIAENYQNQTASQVATSLAQGVGLTPNVAATQGLIGRYYRTDHTRISLGQFNHATTQWDLLVYLADQVGYDVWVDGTTLNFQPIPANPTPVTAIYTPGPVPQFGGMTLELHRTMTLAKDVEVQVRSWNSHSKQGLTVTARGSIKTNAGAVVPLGPPQTFVFVRPNLTHAQAQVFAQQKVAEISKHERVATITMPGDLTTTPRDMVALSGTGTAFDQTYYIETLDRSLSWDGGFVQTLRLKNHSPQTETLA